MIRLLKHVWVLFFAAVFLCNLNGQNADIFPDDFVVTGDAVYDGNGCFVLTEDIYWQGGAIWFKKAIDLRKPFSMDLNLSFGCRDLDGADGIVFIFYPGLNTGRAGEGMGFGGLRPSFGIEMDTYQNYHLDDPSFDHVSLMVDGIMNHRLGLSLPKQLHRNKSNIEDCSEHKVAIVWRPDNRIVEFYFDGSLRIEEKIDLTKEIFGGNPIVYWGFASATGDKTNRHSICIRQLEYTENFSVNPADRQILLDEIPYILKNVKFTPGSTRLPESAKTELDQLIDFFQEYPMHSVLVNGYTDSSGNAEQNKNLSRLRAKVVADYLEQNGIPENRVIFRGFGEQNPIEPNNTELGRLKNRRVELVMKILKV